ncbi:hypothetical protein HK098_005777, partial [Nowakowskiella sp. JEL0407]
GPNITEKIHPKPSKKSSEVVIDAIELSDLIKQVRTGGEGDTERVQKLKNEDRLKLHNASLARTSKFPNTISSTSQKSRIESHRLQLEQEELERQTQDLEYKLECDEKRRIAIENAKKVRYCELDLVKKLHSSVGFCYVLEEREKQIQHAKARKRLENQQEQEYANQQARMLKNSEIEEYNKTIDKHNKTLKYAQELVDQIRQREEAEDAEIIENYNETIQQFEESESYKKQQQQQQQAQNLAKKKMFVELQELSRKNNQRQLEEKEQEKLQVKQIQAWVQKKEKQKYKKKMVEKEWNDRAQKVRENLGNRQAQKIDEEDQKLTEQIAQYMKEKDDLSSKQVQAELQKKKNQQDELKKYYGEYLKAQEESKMKQKQEEKIQLEEYLSIQKAHLLEQKEKKEKLRKEGKELHEFHQRQKQVYDAVRAEAKLSEQEYYKNLINAEREEDQQLQDYIRTFLNREDSTVDSSTAQLPARLEQYITSLLAAPPSEVVKHLTGVKNKKVFSGVAGINTKRRLGFVERRGSGWKNESYPRSNVICHPSDLTVYGEKTGH